MWFLDTWLRWYFWCFLVILSGPMARIELKRKRFLRNLPFWRCYWFWVGNGGALFKLCGLRQFFVFFWSRPWPTKGSDSIDLQLWSPRRWPSSFWFYRDAFERYVSVISHVFLGLCFGARRGSITQKTKRNSKIQNPHTVGAHTVYKIIAPTLNHIRKESL